MSGGQLRLKLRDAVAQHLQNRFGGNDLASRKLVLALSDIVEPLAEATLGWIIHCINMALPRGDDKFDAAPPHTPQRSPAVSTGASHSRAISASSRVTVIEQPAMSSEVT